jgi:hypothetical protein
MCKNKVKKDRKMDRKQSAREELEDYGGKPVLDLVDKWETLV